MTLSIRKEKEKKQAPRPTSARLCFGFFVLFCFLLLLKNAEIATKYMTQGLLLCARVIIPSLFPFMIFSELIVSGGIAERLLCRVSAPLRRVLGLSDAGCCAVLLGMLCGFPVGAKCISLAYDRGRMTKKEAERALSFSGNPSSAFLISAVGASLWNNQRLGLFLFVCVIVVNLLTAILSQSLFCKQNGFEQNMEYTEMRQPSRGIVKLFTESVASATGSMLLVCAYVIFFSVLGGTLSVIFSVFHFPAEIHAVMMCLLELSGGVERCVVLSSAHLAAILTAFAAGWSGLSVHCQVMSVCDGRGFSFRFYMIAKLLQGVGCALLCAIAIRLFPALLGC